MESIPGDLRSSSSSLEDRITTLPTKLTEVQIALQSAPPHMATVITRELAGLSSRVAELEQAGVKFVISPETKKVHAPGVVIGVPPSLWRTTCGWRFGLSRYTVAQELPTVASHVCKKCFPEMHNEVNLATSSSSSSSASDS